MYVNTLVKQTLGWMRCKIKRISNRGGYTLEDMSMLSMVKTLS